MPGLQPSMVLFIPETGIYPYLRSLAILGDTVTKHGEKVYITKCSGQLPRCIMMDMHQLPINSPSENKAALCKICSRRLQDALNNYNFSIIELSDFVDENLTRTIDNFVDTVKGSKENLCYKGFAVGQIAQFDFTLATKYLYRSDLSAEHQLIYNTYIKNISLTISIADAICRQFKPSMLLTFGEYGHYQGARHAAIMNDVSRKAVIHPMHLNADYSRFIIWSKTNEKFFYSHCQKWINSSHIPISPRHVKACWDDTIYRLFNTGSSHIFSSRKQIDSYYVFNKLNLSHEKKTVVVYTCSYDERQVKDIVMKVWGEGPRIIDAFPSQIDWLMMLREYASQKDNIQIVVRVHPREGSRQYGFASQHLKQLQAAFTENSSNFIIVWADDPISSYDLMELADICLVPWSLMGQEAARLGIPVLSCTGNMFYQDDDFIQVATNPEEYKHRLDSMLDMEYTWLHLVKAIRFNHWRTFVTSLDLGETVTSGYDDDTIWPKAPGNMVDTINDILKDKKDLIACTIKKWTNSLPANAVEQESEAVRQGIRYFIDKMFYPPRSGNGIKSLFLRCVNKISRKITGKNILAVKPLENTFIDYELKFSDDVNLINDFVKETSNNPKLRVIVADDLFAVMVHKGRLMRKMSPMIIRLARLHDSSAKNSGAWHPVLQK